MPLDAYPFAEHYGWAMDKYGVGWQLMLTKPEGDPRPHLIPSLLFTGEQPKAAAALDLYKSALPFEQGALAIKPEDPTGEGIMFTDFKLADLWMSAMDGGPDHKFGFANGFSYMVWCDTQEQVDEIWEKLSAVPEAEQCGWLQDEFGLSWQILPKGLGEKVAQPGGFEKMMQMKKIDINEF